MKDAKLEREGDRWIPDHTINFIIELGKMSLYVQQFVERAHQIGKKGNNASLLIIVVILFLVYLLVNLLESMYLHFLNY